MKNQDSLVTLEESIRFQWNFRWITLYRLQKHKGSTLIDASSVSLDDRAQSIGELAQR